MGKKVVKTDNAPAPVARYSQGIKIGNTLYVQGVIALDPVSNKLIAGDISAQAKRVFESIGAILESASMTMADVVKVTAFLSDLKDYPGFNDVYSSYFTTDPPPVRTTVQAHMPFGALLEVEVIACSE